jgi:Outer membrane lipoprotein-sorting protein
MAERNPDSEGRNKLPPCRQQNGMSQSPVAWRGSFINPSPLPARACPVRNSGFGLLSAFGLRPSGFTSTRPGHPTRGGLLLLPRLLLLLLVCALPCFGQRNAEPRPAPLDPVEGEKQGRTLVTDMLAQSPDHNTTNTGSVRIRDAAGNERQIPARFEVYSTPTNWVSVYEVLSSAGGPWNTKLTVFHHGEQPNRYELWESAAGGGTNAASQILTPAQLMVPFAGSDFWIADLGLEFLHWPSQRVLSNDMRHSKSCRVLESLNPAPVPGGYARVVSWIMIERPHGIMHADAYDARGERIKYWDPKNIEKVQGEYQLEEMEIRNRQTGSQTFIKFNLDRQ